MNAVMEHSRQGNSIDPPTHRDDELAKLLPFHDFRAQVELVRKAHALAEKNVFGVSGEDGRLN